MQAWKYIVLVGGIAGVVGFFLPFITFDSGDGQLTGSVSAYQLVKGIDDVTAVIDGAKPVIATNRDAQAFVRVLNEELVEYRGVLMGIYVPAVALALLGGIAGVRRRMGRIAGLIAIALGLLNIGIWSLFYTASTERTDSTVAIGVGLHLLLVAGIAGAVAGLGALFAPERYPE